VVTAMSVGRVRRRVVGRFIYEPMISYKCDSKQADR
jgi:hypothetical protein